MYTLADSELAVRDKWFEDDNSPTRWRRQDGVWLASLPILILERMNERLGPHDDADNDLIERLPVLGRRTTHLERSVGPSCLLSLIIVALLVIVLRRYIDLAFGGMACLTLVVWLGVLTLLLRWKPDVVDDDDE